jgi:hypothetical protein
MPQGRDPQQRVSARHQASITESHPLTSHRLILTYLIPCHLLTTHTLPTLALLSPYPRLQQLFLPLSRCIKKGDLSGFDAALVAGEDEFVKRRIYLTLERGRDIALRNLLRKVFIAGGFEEAKDANTPPVRRTRIPVAEFGAAISLGSKETMDSDEVECLLANMIYKVRYQSFPFSFLLHSHFARFAMRCAVDASRHPPYPPHRGTRPQRGSRTLDSRHESNKLTMRTQNLMKGYIARERGIVVLSKGGAFPGTGV